MPRERTKSRSTQVLEGRTWVELFNEVDSFRTDPLMDDSWETVLSERLAIPSHLPPSDFQNCLESAPNDRLIDCILDLRRTLEANISQSSRKKRNSSSVTRRGSRWQRSDVKECGVQRHSAKRGLNKRRGVDQGVQTDSSISQPRNPVHRHENEALKVQLHNRESENESYRERLFRAQTELRRALTGEEQTHTEFTATRDPMMSQEVDLEQTRVSLENAVAASDAHKTLLDKAQIELEQKDKALQVATEDLQSYQARLQDAEAKLLHAKNEEAAARSHADKLLRMLCQKDETIQRLEAVSIGGPQVTCDNIDDVWEDWESVTNRVT